MENNELQDKIFELQNAKLLYMEKEIQMLHVISLFIDHVSKKRDPEGLLLVGKMMEILKPKK